MKQANSRTDYPNAKERAFNRIRRRHFVRKLRTEVPQLRDPKSPLSRMVAILDAQFGPKNKYREPWHLVLIATEAVQLLKKNQIMRAVSM